MTIKAIIFDVDGTLADTENGHRKSFNKAFAESGLDWNWDVALYDKLLKVTGGNGVTVGPILLGAAAPVHVLTPSSTVRRVVNMTALAAANAAHAAGAHQ